MVEPMEIKRWMRYSREKAQLFSPFEGLINADINPQLQDKD